jgi:hypothetical protein
MQDSRYEELLGPERFRCRAQWQTEMYGNGGWISLLANLVMFYVFLPICILFLGMYAAIITGLCIGVEPDPKHPACLTAFVLACAALVWFCYILPRFDHLIVHEDGFRIRMLWKHLVARFDGVAEWRVGFVPAKLERGLRRLGDPALADLTRAADAASVVVTLTDGARRVFRNFFKRFDKDDLGRFLGVLVERCGERVVVEPSHQSSVVVSANSGSGRKQGRRSSPIGWLHIVGFIVCAIPPLVALIDKPTLADCDVPWRLYKQVHVGMTITEVQLLLKRDRAFTRPRNLPGHVVEYHWTLDDGTQAVVRFQNDRLLEMKPEP